jgi:hypothetical protein
VFAHAVAVLKGLPVGEALRDFTDLHRRATGYRPGQSAEADREWAGLAAAIGDLDGRDAVLDRVVDFMAASNLHRYSRANSPYGPFRYDFHAADRSVRLHFGSLQFYRADAAPRPGLLSRERLPELRESLKRMFTEIRTHHPAAQQVRGGSWLYNWESYRRLYPAVFTASAEIQRGNFTGGSRWGQFHTGQGEVNIQLAAEFRTRVARLDPDNMEAAFPIATLSVRAPIAAFYREYGVG